MCICIYIYIYIYIYNMCVCFYLHIYSNIYRCTYIYECICTHTPHNENKLISVYSINFNKFKYISWGGVTYTENGISDLSLYISWYKLYSLWPPCLLERHESISYCLNSRHLEKKKRSLAFNCTWLGKEEVNKTHFPITLLTAQAVTVKR